MSIECRICRGISIQTNKYVYGYFAMIDNATCILETDASHIANENITVFPDTVCRCLGKYVKIPSGGSKLVFETDLISFPELDFVGYLRYNEDRCYWDLVEVGPDHRRICNGKILKISELSDYELSNGILIQ